MIRNSWCFALRICSFTRWYRYGIETKTLTYCHQLTMSMTLTSPFWWSPRCQKLWK